MGIFRFTTNWFYETSEDTTYSAFAAVSNGRIRLVEKHGSTIVKSMTVKYRAYALNVGVGLPVGYSESHFSDFSRGDGPVAANRYFDELCFPCHGYIFTLGASLGAFQQGPAAGGANASVFAFGIPAFAALRCYGVFRGTTPGAGMSGALAEFSLST